jgi:cysteinyl-tRNA synthetase
MIRGMAEHPSVTAGLEEIRLHDTRRRAVVPFKPVEPGRAGIYPCHQHPAQQVGAAGYEVTYVTNITDVGHLVSDADEGEDKLERAAATSGEEAADIAARYTQQWADDRRRLGCLEPDVVPRAADHIAEQIAMVATLEGQGRT